MFRVCWPIVCLVPLLAGGCAGTERPVSRGPAVVTGAPIEGSEGFFRAGALAFGPQPDPAAIESFQAMGITTVINLRSRQEMADLLTEDGLDEPSLVAGGGMQYIHIPLGGEDGYEPADVAAFAAAVERAPGPVLVHCASGGRARTMWQAYLVSRRGYTPAQAETIAGTLGGAPSPLEQLLGRDVQPRLGGQLPARH